MSASAIGRHAARINRRNVFLPLEHSRTVAPDDSVRLDISIRPADLLVTWSAAIQTEAGLTRSRHSTLGGMLLAREDLRAHEPASQPRLSPRGAARRTVLNLCDGGHRLADIEREVFARHPALFATSGEAQAFVAEVVSRYGSYD